MAQQQPTAQTMQPAWSSSPPPPPPSPPLALRSTAPSAVVDSLLELLCAMDVPLRELQARFRSRFDVVAAPAAAEGAEAVASSAVSSAAFQAANCCAHMLLQSDSEEDSSSSASSAAHLSASLRPAQRIAALWLLFSYAREDPPPATLDSPPAIQMEWHWAQLRRNPFLESIAMILERDHDVFATAATSLPPSRRIEFVFLLRCIALMQFAPAAPLRALAQWAQASAHAHAATEQSASALAETAVRSSLPSFVEAAVQPLRGLVKELQPHPAIMSALDPLATMALDAQMRVPAAWAAHVLGENFVAAAAAAGHAEAASSSVAAAASSSFSTASSASASAADSSSSSSTVLLRARVFPPHLAWPSMLTPLDWGPVGTSQDPSSVAAAADPPELQWMHWDPPDNIDWNAPLALPAHLQSPLHAPPPHSPHTPSSSAGAATSTFATLLTKACKVQLPAVEKAQLLGELRCCSSVALAAAAAASSSTNAAAASAAASSFEISPLLLSALSIVPPHRLALLVEKNHEVASEMLLHLMATTHARMVVAGALYTNASTAPSVLSQLPSLPYSVNDYLSPLVCMEMSLHSMEVAKALSMGPGDSAAVSASSSTISASAAPSSSSPSVPSASAVSSAALRVLPPDFLHLYICKCLASVSKLSDKFLQARHVRLICAFLTTLIRKKIIIHNQHSHGHATHTTSSSSLSNSSSGRKIGVTKKPNGAEASAERSSASSSAAPSAASSSSPSSSITVDPSISAAVAPPASASEYDVRDVLLVEVSSFLVEFASHKDAATLYKLIKTMEANSA